jgi:predicted transcriptional regulator
LPGSGGSRSPRPELSHHVKSTFSKTRLKSVAKANQRKPAVSGYKEVSPEQLIPLEDGEFKEF